MINKMSKERIAQILAINYLKSDDSMKANPTDTLRYDDKMKSIANKYNKTCSLINKYL